MNAMSYETDCEITVCYENGGIKNEIDITPRELIYNVYLTNVLLCN